MPRKMRVEYPGAIYHVMSRGDRREDIFLDDGRGPARLSQDAGRGMSKDGFSSACLLSDAQSFSSGAGDAQRQPGGGHGLALKKLLNGVPANGDINSSGPRKLA